MQLSDPDPVLDAEAGIEALHALTGVARSRTARHLGLTTSRIEWRSAIRARALRLPDAPAGAAYCAVPAEVALTLAQMEHRIHIASEIPKDGCLFAEVETHERRHVAVNRDALRTAARQMRVAAEAWARTAEGRGPSPEAALEALRQGLRRAIEPAMTRMREAQARGHAAIDTPAEYRRLARVCPDDQAVLAERLRGG